MNEDRFTCINAAIWNLTGESLGMVTHAVFHGRATVKEDQSYSGPGYIRERTRGLRLDDAIDRFLSPPFEKIVLKLDVEGAELEALEGLGHHLQSVELIVYEDHGKDAACTVTKHILSRGFEVFGWDGTVGLRRMRDLHSVQSIKTDVHRGYNFFACRQNSSVFHSLLDMSKS
jgi:FkbM family methyltransferase